MTGDRSFWVGRSVLVTGATGLVGSSLVRALLDKRANVAILLRDHERRSELFRSGSIERVAVTEGELESPADVERAIAESGASVVFHLGAQTLVGVGLNAPLLTFESNVRGTYNLLEACRRQSRTVERVVVASSDKAYGQSDHPYGEDDPLRASSPYDVSKAAADLIAQSYHATYGLRIGIVRCGNIYGGGDLNWSRIVPGTIRSFVKREPPEIRSDGTYVRDYIYIADVVDAYLRVAEALDRPEVAGQAFNFASGEQVSVLDMVNAIAKVMGGQLPEPRVLNTAKNEIKEQRLSTDKAKRILGWKSRVSLDEGLRSTIEWYRAYLGAKP
ncbi:MAG: NAD-dependent epimerase/dehydratase family protein [Chloroflexota bacterium]|nr:NAD-dependent epimerase/dehydratase family protein [Chloroflexota bacterium]